MASPCRRAVVKLGSSTVTTQGAGRLEIDRNTLYRLATDIAQATAAGAEIAVVSSGAVALGVEELGLTSRPTEMADLQACAAVGQSVLMQLWRDAFERHGRRVGQILLTHSDLADRRRFLNVRATLDALLSRAVVPIINENDSVMTDEITVGDNDQLASQVAKLIGAERLVLLTSVDGLLDADGTVVAEVQTGDTAENHVGRDKSALGRGGMGTKLQSARAAAHGGIEVIIANGRRPNVVGDCLAGFGVGTRVLAADRGLAARKHWIAYTLRPVGRLTLDAGAVRAVVQNGASLLPVGVRSATGEFLVGDPIALLDADGREFARGLARITSAEMADGAEGVVIHRDDLVVLPDVDD